MVQEDSLLGTLKRVRDHLAPRRKRQLKLLALMLVVAAVFEILTLASVPLFISTLMSPEAVLGHDALKGHLAAVGVQDNETLRLAMAVTLALFASVSTVVRLVYTWVSTRLAQAIRCDFSEAALDRTMRREWIDHVRSNSGVALSGIVEKSNELVNGMLQPLLTLVGAAVVVCAVAITLIATEPLAALISIAVSALFYVAILRILRPKVSAAGRRLANSASERAVVVQSALGGMREVILDGAQEIYSRQFSRIERARAIDQAFASMAGSAPRLLMELVFVLLIAGLSLVFFYTSDTPAEALSSLGFLAFSCLRMLPSAQQIYLSLNQLRQSNATVMDTLDLIEAPEADMPDHPASTLPFSDSIRFDDVWFRYREDLPWILRGISLDIRRGERIGIVGATGSGKSSLVDLAMGLLTPDSGQVTVDGVQLRGTARRAWMNHVGHVPQSVFLTDESIAQNICFGLEKPDPERLRKAASSARIDNLLHNDAGERGMRLSGGQRQRVGIARALYRRKDVLVLDEATSALDSATEREVISAISDLSADTTILMIAHRLSTVRYCDRILLLEAGEILGFAPWDELLAESPAFRSLVNAASGNAQREAL